MIVDEGVYLVLRSAVGAYSCKTPPLPKTWTPTDRPHIANLVPLGSDVFRVFQSTPRRIPGTMEYEFLVNNLSSLQSGSIIEIKYNSMRFSYYRKDNGIWTKVAESNDSFTVEVFSHGSSPVVMSIQAS